MKIEPDRLREVFAKALELKATDERQNYLAAACKDDPELRQEVESLLQAHGHSGDFFKQTTGWPFTDLDSARLGTNIGPYKLLEKIGEGGFGVVYLAEQQGPVRRKVALKIIKAGMDTREVIARFEVERQTLALMDHPNIARVLDAGTTDAGRPYFVMELVNGVTLIQYCDTHNLSTNERLRLFIKVCQAVQHAHQKAVIHRDLKPSNILVTLHDGEPVPKVIDFGVAKALGHKLTEKSLFTSLRQMIGTPAYMSPEQAALSNLDIDTRSDIYSLGVLLYELLIGVTPFDKERIANAALDEIRRIIREVEPPKPSTRLGTLGEKLREIARDRHSEPAALSRLVRGDLDWIVMKCLEKDRGRRYETADALALDLWRFLKNEPVTAAAPSAFYRTQKFIRRHKASLTSATVLVALVIIGVAVSAWQAVRANKERRIALVERDRSWQVVRFLEQTLEGVRPAIALGRDTTLLREMLQQATGRLNTELQTQPEAQATLCEVIGRIDAEIGDYAKAEGMFRQALDLETQLHGPEYPAVASCLENLAGILMQESRLVEAEAMLRNALAMWQRLLGDRCSEVANTLSTLSVVLQLQDKLAEAEQWQQKVIALQKQLLGSEHPAVARALNNLAVLLWKQGKLAESERLQRTALAMRRKLLGEEHPDVAQSLYNLALVLEAQGQLKESEALHREALAMRQKLLGSQHDEVADSFSGLAIVLQEQHRPQEAEKLLRDALAQQKELLGPTHLKVAGTLNNLSLMLKERGKLAEAEALCRQALAINKQILGAENRSLADILDNLGAILREEQKLAEAEQLHRQSLAMRQKLGGDRDGSVAVSLGNLGDDFNDQGKLGEAESVYRQALAVQRRCYGEGNPKVAKTLNNLATILEAQHKPEAAATLYRDSLAMLIACFGAQSPELALTLNNLAQLQRDQGKLTESEALYRQAVAVRKSVPDQADLIRADSLSGLQGVLLRQTRFEEAEAIARQCLAIRTEALGEEHPLVVGSLHNLMVLLLYRHKEADYQFVRTALTLARLGLPPKRRQEIGVDKSIDEVNRAIESGSIVPDEATSTYLCARAYLLGERGRWPLALQDLKQARHLVESVVPSLSEGLMLVETGDLEGYADFRRRVLVRFMATQDPPTAAEAAVGMLLQPVTPNLSTASQLADLALDQSSNDVHRAFFEFAKALVEYRRDSFSSAEDWARQSLAHSGTKPTSSVAANALLAMAQRRLGHAATAQATFREAVEVSQTKLPRLEGGDLGENWSEWLLARLMLKEANALTEEGAKLDEH